MTDFRTPDHGTIILIWPVTEATDQWVGEKITTHPWHWFGVAPFRLVSDASILG
jgi:hypothetical protein